MTGPLAHVRVVDATDLRGALAGRLLADLGADVVKVEPPGGDPDRERQPLVWRYRNANKRGSTAAVGDARFAALCADADVLIENLGPDGQAAHGLAPDEVRTRHPVLVHVAIADLGLAGPQASWRLEPLPAFAASGALFASGFPDRPPCWLPGHLAHDCGATFAVAGALAALLDRARTGAGQTVEVSVQEASISGLNPWAILLEDYGRLFPMIPSSFPRNADGNYLVLPVADGHVRVLPANPRQWRAFCALLGNPEVFAGDEWDLLVTRMMNVDVIRMVATEALATRTRAEAVAEGLRLGVPIGPVHTPAEFVATEQIRARGYFRRTGFPGIGAAPFAAAPFVFSKTPVTLRRPAPEPGEDGGGFAPRPFEHPTGVADTPVLAGVRVLSLGVVAVVPEANWLLAELGAEVVKIESRTKLDVLRATTLVPDTPNQSFTFNAGHRGHKSLLLDLTRPAARALALRLAAEADVVTENNRGGVARAWGLDYDDVRRVRPDVIYLASQGYGRGGPLGEVQAFGPMNSAFAGTQWLWNHPDAPYPAGTSLNHPDHVASKLGAVAVLAALEHRRRTGEGQLIDMSQVEAAAFLAGEVYLQQAVTGEPARPRGNAVDHACPHGVYPSDGYDRWVAIAVTSDAAWRAFCRVAGVADDPSLGTLAGRLAKRDDVDACVATWTKTRTAEDAATALQAAGVSAMAVQSGDDHRADAHLAARGAIVTLEHPEVGPERHIGNPIRFGRVPVVRTGPAPLLGADTAAVLGSWLGMLPDEIDRLEADGVCR